MREHKHMITIRNIDRYNYYRKTIKDKDKRYKIDILKWGDILREFNTIVVDKIINDSYEFKMPCNLGYLRIKKVKQKFKTDENGKIITRNLCPDWKKTKELWNKDPIAKKNKKLIYHLNKHSSSYYYKWYWDRITSTVKNQSLYKFIPVRQNKKDLAKAVFRGQDYLK